MADGTNWGNRVHGDALRAFVERIERLEGEKAEVGDAIKAVYAEAKAGGYDGRYMRALIKLRKKSPSERDEDDAMMDLYLSAIGMARETPLFRHVEAGGVDTAAREKVIEALMLLAPENGEITVRLGSQPRMRLWRDKDGAHCEEVKEAPPAPPPSAAAPRPERSRPGAEAPDCSPEQAHELGRQARRDDQPVIANPFAWDDARRRRWDEGWREEDGGDGMGPR